MSGLATIRPLSWQEGGLLAPLLAPLAAQFDTPEDFKVWTTHLDASLVLGRMGVIAAWRDDMPVGGLLHEGTRDHRTVLAALGELDDAGLVEAMRVLQGRARAITFDESAGPDWPERLAPLGFRPFARQTFVQEQARVYFKPMPETALELVPWDDRHRAEVVQLLAAANTGTLDGLFLTMPEWPTEAACARTLDALLSGAEGAFAPWASFVAKDGDALMGVVLAVESAPSQVLLFDLAVHPAARGQSLSRRLVQALQRALAERGVAELLFMTMEANAAVQQLFRREEIVRYEESRGGWWIRPEA